MNKLLFLSLFSTFFLISCSADDSVTPEPEPPVEEIPDEENPDESGSYIIPNDLTAYYDGVDFTLEEDALYKELSALTDDKFTNPLSYGQRHNYLYEADADPQNPDNVILLYTGESRPDNQWESGNNPNPTQTYNTEHVFPKSKLVDEAESDLHLLRAADKVVNSTRNNHPFTDGSGEAGLKGGNAWYPGDEWRGDVARIVMFVVMMYDEDFNDVGNLDLFLEWNEEDPVSLFERQRNAVIAGAQGNRNPFIDNPHLATAIWGGEPAENRWDGDTDNEDTEAPSAPSSVSVSDESFETITLSWEAATDNVAVIKYSIYVDGDYKATSTSTNITIEELAPGNTHSFTVTASDAYGNESEASEAVEGTTITDEEAPSVPANLTAEAVYASSVTLVWDASTDNAEVLNYDVYQNGEFLETVWETEFTIGNLEPETTYTFAVLASDIFDNNSELTEPISVTTEAESPGGEETASAIIITEYIEGSIGTNKVLEIGNISDQPVDLGAYTIQKITNAEEEWKSAFQLEGMLAPGEVIVIANEKSDREGILNAADILTSSQVVNFNGNDPVGLFLNGELIDMIGVTGGDDFAKDVNLRRKATVTGPASTFAPAEWDTYEDTDTSGLGIL